MTCHASIVSRELGIPCIVGTKSRGEAATTTVPDGIDVTVDATHGVVYEGILEAKKPEAQAQAAAPVAEYFPPTGTKIYMNLGDPDLAEKIFRTALRRHWPDARRIYLDHLHS